MKLLEFTLEQNFEVVSVATISSVIESITFLVHHYITCSDKLVSRSGTDSSVGARSCFGGLFASIIRPGDAKAVCGETTRDKLMFDLIKLVNVLVQLPLSGDKEFSGRVPVSGGGMADSSVSDEEKVCGSKDGLAAGSASTQGPPASVADLILANQPVMSQILSALGQCNSSAMAMIIGRTPKHQSTSFDPQRVFRTAQSASARRRRSEPSKPHLCFPPRGQWSPPDQARELPWRSGCHLGGGRALHHPHHAEQEGVVRPGDAAAHPDLHGLWLHGQTGECL